MSSEFPNLVSTLVAVEVGAAFDNGHVIGEAFRKSRVTCPNCNYPQNSEEYERLLGDRISLHVEFHRLLKRVERRWYGRDIFPPEPRPELLRKYEEVYSRLCLIRMRMRDIRPCATCRKRFNPTRRVKHCLFNLPKKQEFIYGR